MSLPGRRISGTNCIAQAISQTFIAPGKGKKSSAESGDTRNGNDLHSSSVVSLDPVFSMTVHAGRGLIGRPVIKN